MATTKFLYVPPKKSRVEPFPQNLSPMLATLSSGMPADQDAYAFEFKWDGYRTLAYWDKKKFHLQSRRGLDFTGRFLELADLPKALARRAVLDGEVVALNEKGAPDFGLLQQRAGLSERRDVEAMMRRVPVVYMIFDVLYLDDRFTTKIPYEERRALLQSLRLDGKFWKTPEHRIGDGDVMFEVARKHGFEGVMAKRTGSLYEVGRRSTEWLKVRFSKRQELVIGGWTYGEGYLKNGLGALLLGYYDSAGKLQYAGQVGTGFSDKVRGEILAALEKLRTPKSPFAAKVDPSKPQFARPRLVAEVQFTEWTSDGKLRHPSFIGLRLDKPARDVRREMPEG